jgi:hypothetical protein
MLVLAGFHLVCGGFLAVVLGKGAVESQASAAPASPPAPHKSSLLRMLAAIVLLGAVGAALLDYVFKVHATEAWGRDADLLRFFALFHTGVALLSFVTQSTASKAVLEKLGLGKSIGMLPATLASGSFLALVAPGAAIAAAARAGEAIVHGSIFRAGYETCYTPIPPAEKRLAKTLIDVGAERGGDALGAGIVWLCLHLAGASALVWLLGLAALIGLCSVVLCGALDGVYIKALARSLESRAVELRIDSELDLTTRSVVFRPPPARPASAPTAPAARDAVVERFAGLRSSDPAAVHAALSQREPPEAPIAAQICLLLASPEHAMLAEGILHGFAPKMVGLLTDLMLDPSIDVAVRRKIPRIVASVPGQRSADALAAGLSDSRFEVRMRCARSLAKSAAAGNRPLVHSETILEAVDRELSIGAVLWEGQRRQWREGAETSSDWLDDLLRDKAHGSLEYVFTLLSLVYDRAPLMAAFRSLHLDDRRLRGTALEYLEGILPAKTRGLLWDILQEHPSPKAGRSREEVMHDLLQASETVVLRFRDPGR